jgi:polysaccharide chain length determinant protein (PEP-CTERM system associated)
MRQRLEKSENDYAEYTEKYKGELPDQLEANLSILERLSQELLDQQQTLRETNISITVLEQEITNSRQVARSAVPDIVNVEASESTDLEQLYAQLEALQARYTENHPSVVRLKSIISKLEETAAASATEGDDVRVSGPGPSSVNTSPQESRLASMKLQAQNMEIEIAETKRQIELYDKRVENFPKRQEELLSIQRDYDNIQAIYESLRNRQLEAEISVNMEKKQQGEQFQIIDSAKIPEKPVAPNLKKLFLATIVLGLGFGCGIVFLLEYMHKSYKNIEAVESALGLPVLATVPAILQPKDQLKQRINNYSSITAVILTGFFLACFTVITLKGVDATLEFVRKFADI